MIEVACAVALHPDGAPVRIVTARDGAVIRAAVGADGPARAAALALWHQAGLETRSALALGTSDEIEADARWHFALCRVVPPVREVWQHSGPDGLRQFHWQRLEAMDDPALRWIAGAL